MKSKKYYDHITSLKGISCVFIMIGHFISLYKHSQQFLPGIHLLDVALNLRISFLLNEAYWLYLFFFISGYLVSKSNVETIGQVAKKSIGRFFRLGFPILFSYLVIYLIYILIGFHNGETSVIFQCPWYQGFYSSQYSIVQVLRGPIDVLFKGINSFNNPYWVLREMFIASIIIYILKYLYLTLSKKNEAIGFSVLVIVTFTCMNYSLIVTACLIGMIISVCEDTEGILNKPYFAFWTIIISFIQYMHSSYSVFNIFFMCLILFIPKVKLFNCIMTLKPIVFLGKISWGIYSFHWPLICSLGAIFMIFLQPQVGLDKAYLLSCSLTAIITIAVSVVFYYTFERLSSHLSKFIDTRLNKITSRLSISSH